VKIDPRYTSVAWLASTTESCRSTALKTQPQYLLLTTNVANAPVGQSRLKSPGKLDMSQKSPANLDMTQTTGAAQSLNSQPLYLIVGNSTGNSVVSSGRSEPKSSSSVSVVPTSRMSSTPVVVVSRSSTLTSSVSGIATASPFLAVSGTGGGSGLVLQATGVQSSVSSIATALPFLAMSGTGSGSGLVLQATGVQSVSGTVGGSGLVLQATGVQSVSGTVSGSGLVLQATGVQSAAGVLANLVLPATPLVRVIAGTSAQPVQYVLPSPTVQTVSLSSPLLNSRLSFVHTSSSNCKPTTGYLQANMGNSQANTGNSQANVVRQLCSSANTKLMMVEVSPRDSLPTRNSHLPLIRPSMGNSQSAIVRQSLSDGMTVGNPHSSDIVGIPVSTAIQPSLGNSQPKVVQQSSLYYVPVGNPRSSGIVGIPASATIQPSLGNSHSAVVQQSSSYYVPVGNSQSSSIMGIPVSLVNSALPQMILVGQSTSLTDAPPPQPQLAHCSSHLSTSP